MPNEDLIIVGASARAACFSARRAGFTPYWIDQFGDFDLQSEFTGQLVEPDSYPQGLVDCMKNTAELPFIYTGALESHLSVLEILEQQRPLLGNSTKVCRAIRNPQRLQDCYAAAGIAHPEVSRTTVETGSWLRKPLHGAGGRDIQSYQSKQEVGDDYYLQGFIEGESRAGVFLGNGQEACLIGVSRQLIGETFLNAAAYAYCGSIGPLQIAEEERVQWQSIGSALTKNFSLKGLFCVDGICRDGRIYPIEINPRYSASVEILEPSLSFPLLLAHRQACEGELPRALSRVSAMRAKAYLFAGDELRCPDDLNLIYSSSGAGTITADIPLPGSSIHKGYPLMTIIAEVENEMQAMSMLKSKVDLLYRQFDVE
ncbi:MAG: ATP-grasp domain-containing protein [Gammaproteobacteria bacterium]|nr:ATP-grasp domain-containing protein [Gammaproteobacteria bacterium]